MSCHFWLMRKRSAAEKAAREAEQKATESIMSIDTSEQEDTEKKPRAKRQSAKKRDGAE